MLHLPAPQVSVSTQPVEPLIDAAATNLITKLLRGEDAPKLTAAQVEAYLKEHGRTAASLLAAFRASGDQKLLEEAMEKRAKAMRSREPPFLLPRPHRERGLG